LEAERKGPEEVRFNPAVGQVAAMGDAAVANVTVQNHAVDGKDLCRVHVRPSAFPVEERYIAGRWTAPAA
jgi:hypothetical protein